MAAVILPDALWSDPVCLYLRRRRLRLWLLLADMERMRCEWHPEDVAEWTADIWAVNLGRSPRQFEKDMKELRALRLIEEDGFRLRLTRHLDPPARRSQESREADRHRQRRHRKAQIPDFVTAPVTPPVTAPVTRDILIRSDLYDPNGTDGSVFDENRTDGSERSDRNGSELNRGAESVTPGVTDPFLRPAIVVPKTIVERYIDVGFTREDAESKLKEFGPERLADALESIPFQKKPIGSPVGWITVFLVKGYAAAHGLLVQRQRDAQPRMTLLAETLPKVTCSLPRYEGEPYAEKPDMAALREALKGRPPPKEEQPAEGGRP